MEGIDELLADPLKMKEVAKAVFDEVDKDQSGQIDLQELRVAMQQVAYEAGMPAPNEADITGVLQALDKDGNGTLDVDEFQVLITEVLKTLLHPS